MNIVAISLVLSFCFLSVPICFSIKKPKEEELAVRSALPYEESEGEGEGDVEGNTGSDQVTEANDRSSGTAMEIDVTDITSPKNDRAEIVETTNTSSNSKPSETTLEKWGTFSHYVINFLDFSEQSMVFFCISWSLI